MGISILAAFVAHLSWKHFLESIKENICGRTHSNKCGEINSMQIHLFIYLLDLVIPYPPIICASAIKAKHSYFLSLLSLQML